MELSLFPLLTKNKQKKLLYQLKLLLKKKTNKKNRGVCNVWVEPLQQGRGGEEKKKGLFFFSSVAPVNDFSTNQFKIFNQNSKKEKKQKNFLKGCRVHSPSYLPLLVSRDVFTREVVWGLGLTRYRAVWMEQVLSAVQYALHKNQIYGMDGVGSDGPEAFKEIRILSFYFIWSYCHADGYIIDYLCVSSLMQCLHFKGTKCVFDREKAVATCSKWPWNSDYITRGTP